MLQDTISKMDPTVSIFFLSPPRGLLGGVRSLAGQAEQAAGTPPEPPPLPPFTFQEAKYHMQRCIDSGLWVPNAKTGEGAEKGGGEGVYEEIKKENGDEEKGNA